MLLFGLYCLQLTFASSRPVRHHMPCQADNPLSVSSLDSRSPVQPTSQDSCPLCSALLAGVTICSTRLCRRGQALSSAGSIHCHVLLQLTQKLVQEERFDPFAANLSVFLSQSILKSPFPGSSWTLTLLEKKRKQPNSPKQKHCAFERIKGKVAP